VGNFDFSKVASTKSKSNDSDWSNPVSFFYKLTHPEIKDLYPVQRDILQAWYAGFKNGDNDKIISLNTGGGKTLTGLMVAESLRREGEAKILYVCPNNYLGLQTKDEAIKCGIKVASYLNSEWDNKDLFLENNVICVTNYAAVFNSKSIFKQFEIKGIIFDDAHLALDLIDDQFTIKSEDEQLILNITNLFKSSEVIKEKINSIQEGDPIPIVMIPPLEWHQHSEVVKGILGADASINQGLPWINLKEKIDKTFCFISAKKCEISFLYPDISNHYAFKEDVHRIYLSATIPNLDDLTRVFGITPSRIEIDSPDYRPQRLFVFSNKTKLENSDEEIKKKITEISPKTLTLVPSREQAIEYEGMGAEVVKNSEEISSKIKQFKDASAGILVLANRYEGIDLPGGICHSLVVDGLPYTGTLKTRFFSDYFHNHQNQFLRSIIASKLVQAFGRTIRSNDDYSIIILLGDKLNSWVINKDNRKFFKLDLSTDIEIGLSVSESILSIESLIGLSVEILNQTEEWKKFLDERRGDTQPQEPISKEEEDKNVKLARIERQINDLFLSGNYGECLERILSAEADLALYSKPILGLYLSMASICCLKTDDYRLVELSARAFGINPIFGMPVMEDDKKRSLQAQRIIDFDNPLPNFDWNITGNMFDENLKQLGKILGFESCRPEKEGNGTLDVCWEDEEREIVLGFENKVDKINKTLSKHEIDQCSGHMSWLVTNYPKHKKIMFAVGDIDCYNELASPLDLNVIKIEEIKRVYDNIKQVHSKKIHPAQVDISLDSLELRIENIFPQTKVINLKKVKN